MNNIGITGDIHTGRGGEQGIKRTERVLNEIVDGWIEHQIKIGVIAGDLFDKYINFGEYTYDVVSGILERAIKVGIEMHVFQGSHDIKSDGIRSAVNPLRHIGAHVHNKICCPICHDGWEITFVPWITKVLMKSSAESITDNAQTVVKNIHEYVMSELAKLSSLADNKLNRLLITHASFVGFSPCSTAASIIGTDFVLDPEMIQKLGYRTIVSGHFHKRDIHESENGIIIYPGAPERLNFGEADNPCGWLELSPEKDSKPIFHELSSPRKFYTFEVSDPDIKPEAYGGHFEGAQIKLRPSISHADSIDYEIIKRPYIEAGAKSEDIIIDPVYTDEVATRSQEIKANQTENEQLKHFANENPDKIDDQDMKLYELERVAGFTETVDAEFIEKAIKEISI
jgi:DNA repair exonuclease SbcCD nuclease subunit